MATRSSVEAQSLSRYPRAPELIDLTQESKATLAAYGAEPGASSYANNCLLARRLVERGVRFVELISALLRRLAQGVPTPPHLASVPVPAVTPAEVSSATTSATARWASRCSTRPTTWPTSASSPG